MSDHRFTAMGCEVLVGGATRSERAAIERLFAEREAVFSRFVPGSELSRVNASAGRVIMVSPLFAQTLRIALDAAAETEGLVVPTLGGALQAAGYTRDSSTLAPDPAPPAPAPPAGSVFALGRFVGLDAGVTLDLNGVVKALAVDDAVALIGGDGFVSAGGDVAVSIEPSTASERVSLFARAYGLTRRETELLQHLAGGADTREVARQMFVSENTVQDHLKSIFDKSAARSRRALLARALGT